MFTGTNFPLSTVFISSLCFFLLLNSIPLDRYTIPYLIFIFLGWDFAFENYLFTSFVLEKTYLKEKEKKTFHLSVHPLMDICVFSTLGLSWICCYEYLHTNSFLYIHVFNSFRYQEWIPMLHDNSVGKFWQHLAWIQ